MKKPTRAIESTINDGNSRMRTLCNKKNSVCDKDSILMGDVLHTFFSNRFDFIEEQDILSTIHESEES